MAVISIDESDAVELMGILDVYAIQTKSSSNFQDAQRLSTMLYTKVMDLNKETENG